MRQAGARSLSGKLKDPFNRSRWRWTSAALAGLTILIALVWVIGWFLESPTRLRARAESAAHNGDWNTALQCWRAINATSAATSLTHFEEARACLTLGRAAQAEHSLHQAIDADPTEPEAWRLLLELLRLEDRTAEVQRLGWEAYERVRPEARGKLLRELTLGLLADLQDNLVRTTLQRWIDADTADVNARIRLYSGLQHSRKPLTLIVRHG